MRKLFLIVIAVLIVAGFLLYMTTYTVRFTEAAVVTTFGEAGDGGVVKEPGLKFKWPAPIQSTTVYDTRARYVQSAKETQQTADQSQIVVQAFMAWRVADPKVFYQRFRGASSADPTEHYKKAEEQLVSILRSAMSEVSKYRLNELLSSEPGASKLGNLEADLLARIRGGDAAAAGGSNIAQYGVEVALVGINRIELPEATTQQVFEAMKATREKIAAQAEGEGKAQAGFIRSKADNDAKKIREFAQVRAEEIRAQGDSEAQQWFLALQEDPALAQFLEQIKFLREGFGKNVTLIWPTTGNLSVLSPEFLKSLDAQGRLSTSPVDAQPPAAAPAGAAAETGATE